MYELHPDLLACKLLQAPKFEDRLDIFLTKFLDPKLFFMKQVYKIYVTRIQYGFCLRFVGLTSVSVVSWQRDRRRGSWGALLSLAEGVS